MKVGKQRHQNRAAAMQFLYMHAINPAEDVKDSVRRFLEEREEPREYYAFAEELIFGVLEHQTEIDETIKKYAQNWNFSRIAKIDLAVLRLALYELLHRTDIPPIVSINEAIDLGKEFSEPDSKRFINGILDRFKDELKRPIRTALEG